MQGWKAQITIVGEIAGYRSITCWICEQRLRQSAVHLRRRISESVILSQPAACTTTTKTEQNSVHSVKSEAELAVDDSTYSSIEADDRHEASRGLFATAELLVLFVPCVGLSWLLVSF